MFVYIEVSVGFHLSQLLFFLYVVSENIALVLDVFEHLCPLGFDIDLHIVAELLQSCLVCALQFTSFLFQFSQDYSEKLDLLC